MRAMAARLWLIVALVVAAAVWQLSSGAAPVLAQAEPVVPPENDSFDRATAVDPSRSSVTLTADTTHATMEPGEEDWCAPVKTVWYTYTPTVTTGSTVSTTGSDFDTVVAVYTGNAVNSLRSAARDHCDSAASRRQGQASTVTFLATAGTTYRIQIGGWRESADNSGRLNASFQRVERFNVAVTAPAGGTVTSAPSGINCGATCSADFAAGSQVTLTANPNSGWVFRGWYAQSNNAYGNLCPDAGPCTLTIDSNQTVSAGFTQPADLAVSLSASPIPVAAGQDLTYAIKVQNAGPSTARNVYAYLPVVHYIGGSFDTPGSTGAPCWYEKNLRGVYVRVICGLDDIPSGGSKTFTLVRRVEEAGTIDYEAYLSSSTLDPNPANDSASLRTTVVRDSRLLTVARNAVDGGNGTVTGASGGINCGDVCQRRFAQGTSVTLTAVPAPGSVFAGWSGACGGTSPCAVTLNGDATVTATFRLGNTACSPPRPRIGIENVLAGDGRIRVTITAGAGSLRSLRFGTAQRPPVNAAIDVELPTGAVRVTGNTPLDLPPNTARQTFYVSRSNPNAATMVPLVVVDECGEWETFVGRGVGGP